MEIEVLDQWACLLGPPGEACGESQRTAVRLSAFAVDDQPQAPETHTPRGLHLCPEVFVPTGSRRAHCAASLVGCAVVTQREPERCRAEGPRSASGCRLARGEMQTEGGVDLGDHRVAAFDHSFQVGLGRGPLPPSPLVSGLLAQLRE